MRRIIRRALTKKREGVEEPPSKGLVTALYIALGALTAFSLLEALHILFLGSFNDTVFNAIYGLVGTIIGIIVGRRA